MMKRGLLLAGLGWTLVGCSAATYQPVASATTFNPCSAVNAGKSRGYVGTVAEHLVFAIPPSASSSSVLVTVCTKQGTKWVRTSSTAGTAGRKGFAAHGAKREGDGKSPTGSFSLTSAFGQGNPGTHLYYRKLRATGDCWGSTPSRSTYNKYYSGTCRSTDENLSAYMKSGPYHQAVVINYNRVNTVKGYGSAIFFHVGGVHATAGCVSIPEAKLITVMRLLVGGDRMIMGPKAWLFRA